MRRSTRIAALTLATVVAAGALGACGGSSSKSSDAESSSVTASGASSATTEKATSSTANVVINIVYKSCNGSTLTIATEGGTGEITGVEISRNDANKAEQRSKMTKNADGTWTGTIPSGAGYDSRISVYATSSTGRKSSRSSPLPLTVEDGSTSTCV